MSVADPAEPPRPAPTGGVDLAKDDQPPTTALRQLVRARKDLVGHRIAVANQLRAHLQICFPGAVGLFYDLDPEISCGSSSASPPSRRRSGSRSRSAPLELRGTRWRAARTAATVDGVIEALDQRPDAASADIPQRSVRL